MVGGLGFRTIGLLLFIDLAAEFALNVRRDRRVGRFFEEMEENLGVNEKNESAFKMFLFGKCSRMLPFQGQIQTDGNKQHLSLATPFIFTRSCFRVAELAKGFGGKLDNEEMPFMVLEGAMIALSIAMMTIFHPGWAFSAKWTHAGWNWKDRRTDIEDGRNSSSLFSNLMK